MVPNQFDEKKLVSLAQRGDSHAKAAIVNNHEQMVFNVALRLLNKADEAECVLQETFLKVFTSLESFRGESELSTWIYRIATNFALMRLRKRKKAILPIEDDSKIDMEMIASFNRSVLPEDPLRMVMNTELRWAMEQAIEKLPPRFKSTFVLKDIEGLSLKQISQVLGQSLPAVKSNLRRARLFLRDHLAEYFHDENAKGMP